MGLFFGCLTRLMRSRQVNALIGYFLKSAAQFAIFAKILEEGSNTPESLTSVV